jgi:hypothetical protein
MKALSALIPVTPTTTCVRAQMTYDNCLLNEYLFNRRRPLFAGFGFIQTSNNQLRKNSFVSGYRFPVDFYGARTEREQ